MACERLMALDEASSGLVLFVPKAGPIQSDAHDDASHSGLTREKALELVIDALAAEKASSGRFPPRPSICIHGVKSIRHHSSFILANVLHLIQSYLSDHLLASLTGCSRIGVLSDCAGNMYCLSVMSGALISNRSNIAPCLASHSDYFEVNYPLCSYLL